MRIDVIVYVISMNTFWEDKDGETVRIIHMLLQPLHNNHRQIRVEFWTWINLKTCTTNLLSLASPLSNQIWGEALLNWS